MRPKAFHTLRNFAFVSILLLAFWLRLYQIDFQSIWWDEGHSIQMASAELNRIAVQPGMDVHPPAYFLLLRGWMEIAGRSEFSLRWLSVPFSLLTVALLMRFGKKISRQLNGGKGAFAISLATGGLAAVSPLFVAYAQEVRMYALLVFVALTSVYAQWQIVCDPSNSRPIRLRPLWILYILATAACLYTHYFTIFLLLFQNLVWLVWMLIPTPNSGHRKVKLAGWLISQAGVLLLFAPQLQLALGQTTAYANPNLKPPLAAEFMASIWRAYSVGESIRPIHAWTTTAAALATLLVLGLGFWRARRTNSKAGLVSLIYLAAWILVPLGLYFLVLQIRPSFRPRYMMTVAPALFLIWGSSFSGFRLRGSFSAHSLEQPGKKILNHLLQALNLAAFLLIAAILILGTLDFFTNSAAFKDDSAGVSAWLAQETTENDLVYVDVPHPFHYYSPRIPAPTRYLFVDVHTAAQTLNQEAAGRNRLYWVTWWGSDTDPRGVIAYLLDKTGRRAGDLDFRGYHVTWWDLPPDAQFSLPQNLSPFNVVFGDAVAVDGVAFSPTARSGDSGWATLHFQLLTGTSKNLKASLRLRGEDGNMLPPTDRDILNDRHFQTSAWPVKDNALNQAINVYTLPLPSDTTPGNYRLELVMYDGSSLEALPVTQGATGDGVSIRLGTINVTP